MTRVETSDVRKDLFNIMIRSPEEDIIEAAVPIKIAMICERNRFPQKMYLKRNNIPDEDA
jgi:hypothetical protein